MTSWTDIVSAAMIQIEDVRLDEQLAVSPAQFYRRMAGWIYQALPLLSKPPELLTYLKSGMTEPTYDDYEWTSTAESVTQETEVDTGRTGYDICSVVLVTYDGVGVPYYSAYTVATYDAETGIVTFPIQTAEGLNYILDFYTDGEFPDLTETQMRLFALAVGSVWDERFERNWLNNTGKIHDSSFDPPNEANYMAKTSARKKENKIALNDELRAYEQMCAYTATVANGSSKVTLI